MNKIMSLVKFGCFKQYNTSFIKEIIRSHSHLQNLT